MNNITLEKLHVSDGPDIFALVERNRTQLKKFWWEQQTQSAADSARFITEMNRLEARNGAPTCGVQTTTEGLIGVAALHTIDWGFRLAYAGYWIDKDYTGKGIGTTVLQQLASIAFSNELDLNQLYVVTREDNWASRKVAEKVGFQLQGIQPEPLWHTTEPLIPTATYTLDAADYVFAQHLQLENERRPS